MKLHTTYKVPYGKTEISFSLPNEYFVDILKPKSSPAVSSPLAAVGEALSSPINNLRLQDFPKFKSVAIAINDKTRPVPHDSLLPPLLAILTDLGVQNKAVDLIIATGDHPVMQSSEFSQILPDEITSVYNVTCHNARDKQNLIYLGKSSRNTPVWVNKQFYNADLRIVVGSIALTNFRDFQEALKVQRLV